MRNKSIVLACACLLASFPLTISAQNKIPQNAYGTREANERLLIENQRLVKEAAAQAQRIFAHSDTILIQSFDGIKDHVNDCPNESLDTIKVSADESFNHAANKTSGKKWEALIQDCWLFVKVTKLNHKQKTNFSSDYFYFRAIDKLEFNNVLDKRNVEYSFRGSKEVYLNNEDQQTVSVSAFRISDIAKYQ